MLCYGLGEGLHKGSTFEFGDWLPIRGVSHKERISSINLCLMGGEVGNQVRGGRLVGHHKKGVV